MGVIQASSSDSHTAAPVDEPNDWQKACMEIEEQNKTVPEEVWAHAGSRLRRGAISKKDLNER